jgi:hypothetical protein
MAQVKGDCALANCPLQPAQAVPSLLSQTRLLLAEAYAAQSRSDFEVYNVHLQNAEECHRLHYLQMACEKIAKAYRLRDTPDFPEEKLYSHVFFSKFISNLLTSPQIKRRYTSQDAVLRQLGHDANRFSREIEKLAPAVDREQTPANTEYPWIQGQSVFAPCDFIFTNLSLLKDQHGREFLKLITVAITDFSSITLSG